MHRQRSCAGNILVAAIHGYGNILVVATRYVEMKPRFAQAKVKIGAEVVAIHSSSV